MQALDQQVALWDPFAELNRLDQQLHETDLEKERTGILRRGTRTVGPRASATVPRKIAVK